MASLLLCGCSRWPDSYPVPAQRRPVLRASTTMIAMDDPDADDYIVKDFAPRLNGIAWRWSYDRPEMMIPLRRAANWRVAMDFTVVPATFKTTGPVTVTLLVNGRAAVVKEYRAPGDYHLEAPVPEGAVPAPGLVNVAVETRPIWTSPLDGKHLGIVLIGLGFL